MCFHTPILGNLKNIKGVCKIKQLLRRKMKNRNKICQEMRLLTINSMIKKVITWMIIQTVVIKGQIAEHTKSEFNYE